MLVFERLGWDGRRTTPRWSSRLLDEQVGFVTPTKHAGQVCTRFAIVNPLTTVDDLELLVDSMR